MIQLAAAVAALALAADAGLPYPPPRLHAPTEKTRCDTGTVLSVEPTRGVLRATTPAGVVTYRVGPDVQVFEKDGKPAGGIARLQAGEKVRVYFVVDDGARAAEIDIE